MKHVWLFTAFALMAVPAFAQVAQVNAHDYASFLTQDERDTLFKSGELTSFGSKPEELPIWQKAPFAAAVRAALPARPSTIAAEGLFLLDLPKTQDRVEMDGKVLKAFTSFSTMKGLLVYSASLKKMETFIYDSYRVDSLENRSPLPDPELAAATGHAEFTLYQKEEQTGDVFSSMKLDVRDGYYTAVLNNLTGLRYLFFQLVAPRELTTLFVVVPVEDHLVLYGVTVANTPRFLGLERMKQSSFFYRMKALSTWFSGNLPR
jgi:hypothetical protein